MTGVGAKLDHLAVAAESWTELWPRYRVDLGGEWSEGGPGYGFAWAQLEYANGMKVEALAPQNWEVNDFLRRFLDSRGPGAHHMTFKVSDIHLALERSAAAGYRPVGVDLRDAGWKEAFLHPKDAPGVVIQLAQSSGEWVSSPPPQFPESRVAGTTCDYVGHVVASMDDGMRLYRDLLNGDESGRGHEALLDAEWIEYRWPTGGAVRLFETDAVAQGVHHAAFTTARAGDVPDAKPLADGRYEVAPEANLGLRLLLTNA